MGQGWGLFIREWTVQLGVQPQSPTHLLAGDGRGTEVAAGEHNVGGRSALALVLRGRHGVLHPVQYLQCSVSVEWDCLA